jgi:hypothetical protein
VGGGPENGKQFIQYYDWKLFLKKYFSVLPEKLQFHHFDFSKELKSGEVHCNEMLEVIKPKGMSHKRKSYLAKEIHVA